MNGTIAFLESLEAESGVENYVLDLERLKYITPFGMLTCAFAIKQFRASLPECNFRLTNHEAQEYAAHMGFFAAFGADFGNLPRQAAGNERYLPVTILSVDELELEASGNREVVQETIQRKAHHMSRMLLQADDGPLVETLGYSLTEMMRNAIEHSGAPQIAYAAQYWPSQDLVEVAILDAGDGIRRTLGENPLLEIDNAEHALNLALLPGVSGKAIKGTRRNRQDIWRHSGYGLYMTSSLCREAGDFLIASDGLALQFNAEDGDKSRRLPHHGTVIRMHFRPSRLDGLQASLDRLRDEGERIAKELGNAVPTASIASRLVRQKRDT